MKGKEFLKRIVSSRKTGNSEYGSGMFVQRAEFDRPVGKLLVSKRHHCRAPDIAPAALRGRGAQSDIAVIDRKMFIGLLIREIRAVHQLQRNAADIGIHSFLILSEVSR